MSRALFVINGAVDRRRLVNILDKVPTGTRVEFKAAKRTLPQNDRMWAMLTEVSRQLPWHGQKLRPDDWKVLFTKSLRREDRMVPNLENDGFVDLSRSTSDLTKDEMSQLIESIFEFGARHGVVFKDDRDDR